MTERDIAKYIRKNPARETEPAPLVFSTRHFFVIPVCDELEELEETLRSVAVAIQNDERNAVTSSSVILVVNHPSDAPEARREANFETLRRLRAGEMTGGLEPGRTLFWIDAAAPGREPSRGVGEARKIGMDAAVAAWGTALPDAGVICSLDADAPVAPEYVTGVRGAFAANPRAVGLSIGVRHRRGATPELEANIRRYERYMREYAAALREAGSPYGFQTIGSAIAVRGRGYVMVGGMRMREAGEDFYFLQALRKVGEVAELAGAWVYPAARISDRVPFGTGPTLREMGEGKELPEYTVEGFGRLKRLLATATEERLRDAGRFLGELEPGTAEVLRETRFEEIWPEVLRNLPKRAGAAEAAFHQWFDGLKTLQFIKRWGGEQKPACQPETRSPEGAERGSRAGGPGAGSKGV